MNHHINIIAENLKEKSINKLSESSFLIAVSGGMDSIYLLHCMIQLQKIYNFNLSIAHYNYNSSEYPNHIPYKYNVF